MHSTERIGRYRLERRLGAGAFGVVWLAHDDVLEATVAVKVLADNWTDRMDIRERFLSEARLLRRADSNRVVQVFDIGELPDDRPYFVMEYADRGTLADRMTDGPLPGPEALRLTAEAARAAAALHEAGIVHRDIKPSNVLFRASAGGDRLLLADLGLAKSLAQASGLTMAAGSAGYMPPEQAQPGAGIDARADVYSLGALGYHLITGTVPGPPGKVVRPDRLGPELGLSVSPGPDVQRALMRALEPDRERRWPTAQEFADELDRLAAGLSQDTDAGGRRRPRGRRRKVVIAVAAAVVVAGGATASAVVLTERQPSATTVRVADSSGRITVEVPGRWAGQLRDSGWTPKSLAPGLRDGQEPGLAVADDLAKWQKTGSDVNGVFVGLSEQGDLATEVAAIAHSDCHYGGSRSFTSTGWQGRVRSWSSCPGGGSFTETGLTPADGTDQPQVYVQIRQHGGQDATDGILNSLTIKD
jgi:hypothetical protein